MDNENVMSQSLVVSLEVCDLSRNNAIELPCVFSRVKLPVSKYDISCQSDVDRWAYLEGIQVPHINAEIDFLIGNDVPEVLQPKEVPGDQIGKPGWYLRHHPFDSPTKGELSQSGILLLNYVSRDLAQQADPSRARLEIFVDRSLIQVYERDNRCNGRC